MSTTGLDVFDQTVQQTNEWLKHVMDEMGTDDRHRAYLALRGSLQALRDYVVPDEAAHLSAQLPMLVRGFYFEGWDPSRTPTETRGRDDFLRRATASMRNRERNEEATVEQERAIRAALVVVGRQIGNEAAQVRRLLPEDVRDLWPLDIPPDVTSASSAHTG